MRDTVGTGRRGEILSQRTAPVPHRLAPVPTIHNVRPAQPCPDANRPQRPSRPVIGRHLGEMPGEIAVRETRHEAGLPAPTGRLGDKILFV